MSARLFTFSAGASGPWTVRSHRTIAGDGLAPAAAIAIGPVAEPGAAWSLRGITSNERYVQRSEKDALGARQEALGRPAATFACLIPLRKSGAWWALTQDERRGVFEASSRHIAIGLRYLPQVARRLHHCRDLSEAEPFDFLTWFEYAPADEPAFDRLLDELRATPEWRYVDRETEIRLRRA